MDQVGVRTSFSRMPIQVRLQTRGVESGAFRPGPSGHRGKKKKNDNKHGGEHLLNDQKGQSEWSKKKRQES